jgi:inner membrane transporter RhtA
MQAAILLNRVPPVALILLAILSIQLGSALAISLFHVYGPLGILFLRMAIGAFSLCIFYRTGIAGALRKAPLGILLLGLTMTVQSGAFYEALSRIPLGITVCIEFLGPLGVALAASRRTKDVLCVLMALAGITLLMPAIGNDLDPVGTLFAFMAAMAWAGFIVVGRNLGRSVEGGVGLAVAMAVCCLILLPVAGIAAIEDAISHPATLVSVAGVALLSAAIPFLFEFLARKSLPPKKYGVLVSLEPVVATLIGMAVLGDSPGLYTWIAIALISAASLSTALFGRST